MLTISRFSILEVIVFVSGDIIGALGGRSCGGSWTASMAFTGIKLRERMNGGVNSKKLVNNPEKILVFHRDNQV